MATVSAGPGARALPPAARLRQPPPAFAAAPGCCKPGGIPRASLSGARESTGEGTKTWSFAVRGPGLSFSVPVWAVWSWTCLLTSLSHRAYPFL